MSVFSKKTKHVTPDWQVQVPAPPTILSRLETKLASDLKELHLLDLSITKLEADIAWLKRHPEAEGILLSLSQRPEAGTNYVAVRTSH